MAEALSVARRRTKNMVHVPGGTFLMGSADFYPEERPVRSAEVDGFWIDEHPVTVADFRRFVRQTGYVTVAERSPDPAKYPDADPDLLVPGSLVFYPTSGPMDLRDVSQWWRCTPGADWRHPRGPGSTTDGLDRHPVTHVAAEDADADADASWVGKALPTEVEWCARNYCLRYRPAARQAEEVDTSTQHIGFRCVLRAG